MSIAFIMFIRYSPLCFFFPVETLSDIYVRPCRLRLSAAEIPKKCPILRMKSDEKTWIARKNVKKTLKPEKTP